MARYFHTTQKSDLLSLGKIGGRHGVRLFDSAWESARLHAWDGPGHQRLGPRTYGNVPRGEKKAFHPSTFGKTLDLLY